MGPFGNGVLVEEVWLRESAAQLHFHFTLGFALTVEDTISQLPALDVSSHDPLPLCPPPLGLEVT